MTRRADPSSPSPPPSSFFGVSVPKMMCASASAIWTVVSVYPRSQTHFWLCCGARRGELKGWVEAGEGGQGGWLVVLR